MSGEAQINRGNKAGAPKWATRPFSEFMEDGRRLQDLVHLSMRGIAMITSTPGIIQAIAVAEDRSQHPHTLREVEAAKSEADLARREQEEGYPLLHAQAVVTLWGMLESSVRNFLSAWIQNRSDALELDEIKKLRVRVGEYEALTGNEKYFYILDQLERENSSSLKSGINRFEEILAVFGLSGEVDKKVAKKLYELHQVRNVLVHRGGLADPRFLKSCPWMKFKSGDKITVEHSDFAEYVAAVQHYAVNLVIRIGERCGADMKAIRANNAGHLKGSS